MYADILLTFTKVLFLFHRAGGSIYKALLYVVQSLYNVSFDKTCVLHFSFIIIPFVTVIRNVSFEYTLSDYMIILSSEYIVHSTVDQQVQGYI